MVSLEFFSDIIVSVALWPSASNRNEYQESSLGGKGGRCVELTTLTPSFADCLKTWEPRPPGALRACQGLYGTTLPNVTLLQYLLVFNQTLCVTPVIVLKKTAVLRRLPQLLYMFNI
jgi:hypothetical protein